MNLYRPGIPLWIRKHRHYLYLLIVCMGAIAALSLAQEHTPGHSWDYGEARGPNHWGDLEPAFATCKDGRRQSPIDIRRTQKAEMAPIEFRYVPSPLRIVDNGHTVVINYAPGSSMSVGGKTYVLKQFHFHRPSEEKINGRGYEMSAHFVHANAEGELAVVAVLLQEGVSNPLVHQLWDYLPKQRDNEQVLDTVQIDATRLMPVDHAYYNFPGSLTTPPCSENVTWLVLKQPATVSAAEIAQFSKLYPNNARPTQPIYDRIVLESQ